MYKVILHSAAVFLFTSAVYSKDLPYKPLVENVATLSVALKWCEEYQVDAKSAIGLLAEKHVDITKPPYEEVFDATRTKLESIMSDVGVNRFCSVTYERYKPGGVVPGFMMRR